MVINMCIPVHDMRAVDENSGCPCKPVLYEYNNGKLLRGGIVKQFFPKFV